MRFRHRSALIALIPWSLWPLAAGCRKKEVASAPSPAPPARPTPPAIDYQKVRPDELGKIPVIMYHEIGGKVFSKDPSLNRTVPAFQKDLQLLYDRGFCPVNMGDVVNDRIDVPAGKSPVVLTFDDARETQFRLIETKDTLQVDPNCGVGILEAFVKKHPDWKLRATFFVLPKSRMTMESFRQTGLGAQKLRYLLDKGMEIGNHSTFHKSFGPMSAAQIQQEIGGAHKTLTEEAPAVKIETFALPMGKYPKNKANWEFLRRGTYQGTSYDYKAVLLAAWRPIPSPSSKEYNPMRLERIAPVEGVNGMRYWIEKLATAAEERYVSDGDPNTISFPKASSERADMARLKAAGKRVNGYEVEGASGGSKPIVSS